jgi:cytochrome b561
MSKNTREQLTMGTVAIHWLMAFAIIGMIAFGLYLDEMLEEQPFGVDLNAEQLQLIGLHKSFGLLVLVFAVVRIYQRLTNPFPGYVGNYAQWEHILSKITTGMLALGTLLMPISGIMMSIGAGKPIPFFGFMLVGPGVESPTLHEIGDAVHGVGGKLLIGFIVLHVVGALKHRFLDGDGTMHRMAGLKVEVSDVA